MDETTTTASKKSFSIRLWIGYTFLGWFSGILFIIFLSSFFDGLGIESMQFYIGLGMGATIGFVQWHLLKRAGLGIQHGWVWHSLLGLGLPFLIFDLLSKAGWSLHELYLPVCVSTGGLLISLFQYRLLKPALPKANYWIAGSFAAWLLAAGTVLFIDYTKYVSSNNWVLFFLNLFLILFGGVVLGVITGTTFQYASRTQ
jgi:hypothetical protein